MEFQLKLKINAAVRFALVAFRTTPISNMLFESNILPLERQRDLMTDKLLKCLYNNQDSPLSSIINKCIKTKKNPKIPSVIVRIIKKTVGNIIYI